MNDKENEDSSRRTSQVVLLPESVASGYSRDRQVSNLTSNQSDENEENMISSSSKYNDYIRPLFAEFIGQLMFAFIHSSTANTISTVGGAVTGVAGNPLLPAVADGLTVTIAVITIGGISGAHVNFSVTTAVALSGGMKLVMVPFYLIAQLLGSLAGAGLALATNGEASGQFGLAGGVTIGQGLLMELILTFFLTFAVLMAAIELNSVQAAFAIGFTILIDILAGANITGGCMNPTLSFGPAVVTGHWKDYWIYWVGPLLGATISAIIFRLFLGDKYRLLCRPTLADSTSAPLSPSSKLKMEESQAKASNYKAEAQTNLGV